MMNDLALIAAGGGLALWLVARRAARLALDNALRNFEARARWLDGHYARVLADGIKAAAPIELPSGGLTVYAAGRMKNNPAVPMIKQLKAGGLHRQRRAALIEALTAQAVGVLDVLGLEFDCIAPAPPTVANLARRGYNHVADISMRVAAAHGVACIDVLEKDAGAGSQVSVRRRAARLENMRRAVRVRGAVAGRKILIIDDVTTTGATLEACAAALCAAGAAACVGLVLASDRRW